MGDQEPQSKAERRAFGILLWIVVLVYLPLMGLMVWSFFTAEPDPR